MKTVLMFLAFVVAAVALQAVVDPAMGYPSHGITLAFRVHDLIVFMTGIFLGSIFLKVKN